MHLNATVHAGAEHVLCRDEAPLASLARAAEAGATHYYGLPARLHRLARDPRLDRPGGVPALPALTAVLSGGAALAPTAAARLRAALRVPVIQGYGLAELSPLSHTQRPDAPCAHDCVGRPVQATQCRIVHLDTRRPLPPGEAGEVQLRGPQLMAGYLGDAGRSCRVDADGWFSTGDVGFEDPDGCLHLVDRLGDVFKHDNDLVAPTAVERVLAADPRVAECVVADWPDPDHGAVVWAGLVLHGEPEAPPARRPDSVLDLLDAVVSEANAQLAPHERIRRVEALDAVPRTPTGKPARAAVRARLHAEAAAEHAPTPSAA
jgi:long-chain acyl-CoA synthetase